MDPVLVQVLTILGLIAGPGGAAWVAVRVGLNGARKDIGEIKSDVKGLMEGQGEVKTKCAVMETRLERLESAYPLAPTPDG